MAEPYAREFTPEMTREFLSGQLADISDIYRAEEGRATAEAGARGLLGTQQGDAMVGQTRTARARGLSDAIVNFNMGVAGLKREERLGAEGRDFTREGWRFEAGEAEKDRAFQEKLANMGYKYGDAAARRDMIYGQQGAVMGAGLRIGTNLLANGLAQMSDRRLKKSVRRVGEVGQLGVYDFEYRRDEFPELDLPRGPHRGFMADEVERICPQAVFITPSGFRAVDYAMLGGRP